MTFIQWEKEWEKKERALKILWVNCFCRACALCWAGQQEAVVCCLSISFLSVTWAEATGWRALRRESSILFTWSVSLPAVESKEVPVAQPYSQTEGWDGVLFAHSFSEVLLLTFQQGQETGSQTKERSTRERPKESQEKIDPQIRSSNWLILLTSGRVGNGNKEDFLNEMFLF